MSWCWTLGRVWRLLVLRGRVVGRWHRWLGVLVEGDGGRGVLALLVLYSEWSARLVSSDGSAHSVVAMMAVMVAMRLPLLGVCSQETSTPWTWSMVAKGYRGPCVPLGGGDDVECGCSRVRVRGEQQQQQQLQLVVAQVSMV